MSPRVLLTDILFPSKYAKWRLVEIRAFIDRYHTDILVPRRINRYIINFTFDFHALTGSHSLDRYDLLIFNPALNHLNIYNEPNFDGTKYNSNYPFDYMLRLKQYREQPVDFSKYALVYHIFFQCYAEFNSKILYPHDRQFIHLYPGGKMNGPHILKHIHPSVSLIITQNFITQYLKNLQLPHRWIESLGGPYLHHDEQVAPKEKNTGRLSVCFTAIGNASAKGAHVYQNIVQTYQALLPNDQIDFYYIGAEYSIKGARYLGLLSQEEIDLIYRRKIDVLLNLDTGSSLNGFPLGIEGLVQGVVLFTPDYHGSNHKNGFDFGPELQIINVKDTGDIVGRIKKLHDDRDLLHQYSQASQDRAVSLFSYEATMEKTFDFIQSIVNMDFRAQSNPGYPSFALNCLTYKFGDDQVNTQCTTFSRDLLRSYAERISSGLIVEIGVLGGATLLDLVKGAAERNNRLIGIDPFDQIAIYNGVSETEVDHDMVEITHSTYKHNRENLQRIIQKYQLQDTIQLIPQPSEEAVDQIQDGSVHLLHIDGDHSTDGVYRDLTNYYPKMIQPGGIIIGDDFSWPSVQAGLDRFCQEREITYTTSGKDADTKFIIVL